MAAVALSRTPHGLVSSQAGVECNAPAKANLEARYHENVKALKYNCYTGHRLGAAFGTDGFIETVFPITTQYIRL